MKYKKVEAEGDEYCWSRDLWLIKKVTDRRVNFPTPEQEFEEEIVALIPNRGEPEQDRLAGAVMAALRRMAPRPPKKPRKKRGESPSGGYE